MKYTVTSLFFALFFVTQVFAQQVGDSGLKLRVIDADSKAPVAEASFTLGSLKGEVADGKAEASGLSSGAVKLVVEAEGFETFEKEVVLVSGQVLELTVELESEGEEELAEVIVRTTRTGREIQDEPTRVEAIDAEEIDEKSNMRSSNVSMILNESTGIKVQQTSATAYTQSVRIQGLDGRYTQILKDGFPAFGGFSGSLSILDILPLDLEQVEIIKGSSSTFYGGGAIAGVINFISKEPREKPSTTILLNQTSALGSDASVFRTSARGRFAYTFLGSVNIQREYDADGDFFTDLPRTRTFTLNPRVFFDLSEKTKLVVGNSVTMQRRTGGDIAVVRDGPDAFRRYFEKNDSERNVTTLNLTHELASGGSLSVRQSLAYFSRDTKVPDYRFKGNQLNSFSEFTLSKAFGRHAVVAGANVSYDRFREDPLSSASVKRDEVRRSAGVFIQDTFELAERVSFEGGLRTDVTNGYGTFVLPRASVLFRLSDTVSSRVGYGLGYKAPSMFTEEAETLLFRNVLAAPQSLKAETSRGGTVDFNYKREFTDEASVSLNQMFFITEIDDALILRAVGGGRFAFTNAQGRVRSRGFETNLRIGYGLLKVFAGYTFTDAKADYLPGDRMLTLTPKGRLNSAVLLEKEESFKMGLESYFTGRQTLSDRSMAPSYWVVGLFGEKIFGNWSVFVNAENITDTRQTRFGPVVFPPRTAPTFAEIFTHTEGRVFNGGVKLRF